MVSRKSQVFPHKIFWKEKKNSLFPFFWKKLSSFLLKSKQTPKEKTSSFWLFPVVWKLFFQFGDYFLMCWKPNCLDICFFLIVSAKHIEKIWLHLSVVWEHFKILKYSAGRGISFYPAWPSACYSNDHFLAYFTPFLPLIFALILNFSGQGLYLPLQLFGTLYI